MRLTDCELERLLPRFMREEPDVVALCRTLDPEIRKIGAVLPLGSIWEHIDELPEEFLDELAKDLDISWYHKAASLEAKREMVKDSDLVHMRLGTRWAVDFVLAMYYRDASASEWFEYGGKPGHFKVVVRDQDFDPNVSSDLYELLYEVKRAGAIMDEVEHTWTNSMKFCIGAAGTARLEVNRPLPLTMPVIKNRLVARAKAAQGRMETHPPARLSDRNMRQKVARHAGIAAARAERSAPLAIRQGG